MNDSLLLGPNVKTEGEKDTGFSDVRHHYCKIAGNGLWFYDRLDNHESGPTIYRALLEQAESKIYVWDPYLGEDDVLLFENLSAGIDVWILTCCDASRESRMGQNFKRFLSRIKTERQRIKFGLKIAAIDKSKIQAELRKKEIHVRTGEKVPHDRFLFIDKRRVFFIGASLQYHSVENMGFGTRDVSTTMIYEIQEQEQRVFLLREFMSYWNTDSEKNRMYTTMIYDSEEEENNEQDD